MKFLLDESTESRLAAWLASQGHDVAAIARDYPHAPADQDVLAIANREGPVLITNDRDFGELIFRHNLPHTGVIFFRMRPATVEGKIAKLEKLFVSHGDRLHSFIVVTERRIRVPQTRWLRIRRSKRCFNRYSLARRLCYNGAARLRDRYPDFQKMEKGSGEQATP